MTSFRTGEPVPAVKVQTIVAGKTTKDELFTRFGDLPAAILGRAEVAVVSTPPVWSHPMGSQYSYSVSSDTIFELFPSAGAAEAYRRIYYYHYVFGYEYPVWFILHFGKNGKTKTGRLWILVNEKTGLVEDYAFRQYGGHTVLGRFPFASRGETVTTR